MAKHGEDWIEQLVAKLIVGDTQTVTLDEIGEAIGDRQVGTDEVERIIRLLEERGVTIVEQGGQGLVPLLKQVIQAAHAIRREGGKPAPTAIAKRSGLSVRAVRVALLYADVLKG